MGNTPSSEAPRKPQKLSKPRVSDRAAAAAAGLPSPKAVPASGHGRYSNSYLVGSLPAAVAEEQPTKPAPPAIGIAVPGDHLERPLRTPHSGSRRNSKRWSGLFDFNSSSSDQQVKRSSIAGGASISNQSTRAGLAQQEPPSREPLSRSLPRSESGNEANGNRGSPRCNLSYEEFQRFILTHETIYEPVVPRSESRARVREVTESTWKSCHPLQPENAPISRTSSQASLYTGGGVPIRRRSLIQTPGVATRSLEHSQRISARSSFRNSLPTSPSLSQQESRESLTARRMSMPPPQVDLEPHVRVASPCDRSYQQVGGMKFGSLRVTNGMPDLSPPIDDETKAQQESHPELGYFGKPQPSSPLANGPSNTTEKAESSRTATQEQDTRRNPQSPLGTRDQSNDKQDLRNNSMGTEPSPSTSSRATPAAGPGGAPLGKQGGTELVDIKEDPNTKSGETRVQLELEHKTVKTLSGADSGIVPSPSSENSRKAVSKADSGYSSNVSLRSFRSLKRLGGDETLRPRDMLKSRIPERTSSVNANSTQRPRVKRHDRSKSELPPPPPPPPKDDNFPVPTRKSSLSSLARDTMNRIPPFRSSMSRDSRSRDSSSSRQKSSLTGSSISKADIGAPIPLAPDSESALDSKLQSPLEGLRTRDFLGNGNDVSAYTIVPRKPVPPSAMVRSESHRSKTPSQSHQLPSHGISRQETPKPVPRAGSVDIAAQKMNRNQPANNVAENIEPKSSPPRKRSLHSLSRSFSQARASLKKAVPSTIKNGISKSAESEAARPEPLALREENNPETGGVRIGVGNGAFTHTIRAVPGVVGSPPPQGAPSGKTQAKPGRSANLSPIKTSKTAPNMEDPNWPLSPPVIPELAHLRKNKTPPPVSMRTRSLKNLRVPSPARSRSAPPADAPAVRPSPVARNRSRDSMHSQRSSPGTTQKTGKLSPIMDDQPGNKPEAEHSGPSRTTRHVRSKSQPGRLRKHPQRDYHQIHGSSQGHEPSQTGIAIPYPDLYRGRSPSHHRRSRSEIPQTSPNWQLNHSLGKRLPVPPVPPKPTVISVPQGGSQSPGPRSPTHSRHGSGSSSQGNPQFRVLHSYNSPAYKGVPIWS